MRVDGQAFFISNGEPLYFWDFLRAVWYEMGDPLEKRRIVLPKPLAGFIAGLSEAWGWLIGKEPAFTRFRVMYTCSSRWHNIEKARLVLGYEPRISTEEGIKRMCDVSALTPQRNFDLLKIRLVV